MNILHIIDSLGLGGAQTVVKGIFEYQQHNSSLFLFVLRTREITMKINHDNVFICNSSQKYSPSKLFKLKNIIKENNIQILHCHLLGSLLYGFLVKVIFFPKIKLVYHEHGSILQKWNVYEILLKFFSKKIDSIIAVSNGVKDSLIKIIGYKEENIFVIFNFYDISRIGEFVKEPSRHDKVVFGFIGRLDKLKGCEYIINSLKFINYPYSLIIAGDGPEKENLIKLATDNNVIANIKFLGYITKPEDFYNSIDVLVIASSSEASPMILYEAQYKGKPIIAGNVIALNEFIKDGYNGFLYKYADINELASKVNSFCQIYQEPSKYQELVNNSHNYIKEYTIERTYNKISDMYAILFN